MHASRGDGNPVEMAREWNMLSVLGPTPTQITVTTARCVGYRSPYAIAVQSVRLFSVAATTNLYRFAIYPRGLGSPRAWESGPVTTTAGAWKTLAAPVTLAANTDYWFCVGAGATGTTAAFRSMAAPLHSAQYGADVAPLGSRSLGLPVLVQFPVVAGAFPVVLPAVVAAAYSAGTTGTVPFALFDSAP